ncbi:IMPACT family protein [Campylobacter majalis]|uniref:IMPACT family protein n=1 Tax=Campylobacter majalis TaxID=2790656 RepID=UPI003D690904
MNTINEIFSTQIEIKKSSFLAFLVPIDKFSTMHEMLKQNHPKAVHIVWAKREINKYNQIVENQSDDGEPKGTSGPPSLNALRGANLVDCGVLIVRYFGGIKLGTGGLVRAYGGATNEVIKNAKLIKFDQKSECVFYTPFSLMSRFEHFLNSENLSDFSREFDENGARWIIKFKQDEYEKFHSFSHTFEISGFILLAIPLFAKNN